jgi:hypothetical protein
MRRGVPVGPVDEVVGRLKFDAVAVEGVVEFVVVLAATEETAIALFGGFVVVAHVCAAAGAPGDTAASLLGVLQVGVDGVDEAARGGTVPVVEGQGGGNVGVRELEAWGVVSNVLPVLLVLLLPFRVVGRQLLVLRLRRRVVALVR